MEEIKQKFEYLFKATEETRIEFMPEFLYFMKLVDLWPANEMIKDFELFAKVATFVNSEDYIRVYHSHDLKRNLQKRVISNPITRVLGNEFDNVDDKMLAQMNYMIKVSDEDMTLLRKFEITEILHKNEAKLREKFSVMFENQPNDVDYIEKYIQTDIDELEDQKPKKKEHITPKLIQKKEEDENEYQLTNEELEKYGLIPEFKSRSKLLKFFRKKSIKNFMKYLKGVESVVKSIHEHGNLVAKIFFLNPIQWTWIYHYTPVPVETDSTTDQSPTDDKSEEFKKALKIATIEKTVHFCNEQQIKVNDLQNFVFQNTKYLLINYPEYGKDIEKIEPILIEILERVADMLESKRLLHEKVDILSRWTAIHISQESVTNVLLQYKKRLDEVMLNRDTLRSPDKKGEEEKYRYNNM